MKILAFSASNNSVSINKKLVTCVCSLYKEHNNPNVEVEIIDLNDFEMPIYRPDREITCGIPKEAQIFYEKISSADALIVSFAEYNGSYTAAYKNIFDWTSRINQKLYQDKPTILMATSPGKRGGANVLKTASDAGPYFGMDVKGTFSMPEFQLNFNSKKNKITNPSIEEQIKDILNNLV